MDAAYNLLLKLITAHVLFTSRNDETDFPKKKKKHPKDDEEKYGCNYEAVQLRDEHDYSTSWGPVGFKKANHPLAIMVCSLTAWYACKLRLHYYS